MRCVKQINSLSYQGDVKLLMKEAREKNFYVAKFDCDNLRNIEGLYKSFAEEMKFPNYFGNNFNALDDCLNDLDWLPDNGFLLIFENTAKLLSDETEDTLHAFLELLKDTSQIWEKEVKEGEVWDRGAIPFKILFKY